MIYLHVGAIRSYFLDEKPVDLPFDPSGEFDKRVSQNLIDKMISLAIIPDIEFRSLIKTFQPILHPSGGHEKR
jgi:hypothetical protein